MNLNKSFLKNPLQNSCRWNFSFFFLTALSEFLPSWAGTLHVIPDRKTSLPFICCLVLAWRDTLGTQSFSLVLRTIVMFGLTQRDITFLKGGQRAFINPRDLVPRVSLLCLHCRWEKTLVDSGHMALVDKHFPTRVVFSLYFDSATGRTSIPLTRHFLNKWSLSYSVSIKKVKRADVLYPQEMNSHKSGQLKYKSFRDRQDNFKSSM